MGKEKGTIWNPNEKKKGGGGPKGPPVADEEAGPRVGKKQAAAEAAMKAKMAELKDKGCTSMDVRHILVEKHSDAVKILEDIKSGKIPFNDAARQHSIDKAGKCGLLGWKTQGELDPDFWAAAKELPDGCYTQEPVRTGWGYHIIKVEGRK